MKASRFKWILGTAVALGGGIGLWHFSQRSGSVPTVTRGAASPPIVRPSEPARALTDYPDGLAELLDRLRSGDPALSPEGITAALAYVRHPRFAENSADPDAEYLNNTIALLLAQPVLVPQLADALLELADDRQQPRILRDYAMQHLFHAWEREEAVERKRQIETRLRLEVKNAESPLQGTALLTMARMFGERVEQRGPTGKKLVSLSEPHVPTSSDRTVVYPRDEFIADAMRTAGQTPSSPTARASAFHALIRLETREAVSPARKVISQDNSDEVLCAAIAAVSAFGDAETDSQALAVVSKKSETVRKAAEIALTRLQARQARP
jgi:hypothetical protein